MTPEPPAQRTTLTLAGVLLLVAFVIAIIPNSAHAGPDDAYFYDCGVAIFPRTYPAEQPGISLCDATNDQMRRLALVVLVPALLLAALHVVARTADRRGVGPSRPVGAEGIEPPTTSL